MLAEGIAFTAAYGKVAAPTLPPCRGPRTGPCATSAPELQEQLEAGRRGSPFLAYGDGEGLQRIFDFGAAGSRVTLGRTANNGISLPWDGEVSRTHAELERLGDAWVPIDDGLSPLTGSYVNGKRLADRHSSATATRSPSAPP